MSIENARRFSELARTDEGVRGAVARLAESYAGDRSDDRAVFEAVVAPAAKVAGLSFGYDEALAASLEGRELTDEELEAVAGGAGAMYQRIFAGLLAGAMVVGSVPAPALAEGIQAAGGGDDAIVQVDGGAEADGEADGGAIEVEGDQSGDDAIEAEGDQSGDDAIEVDGDQSDGSDGIRADDGSSEDDGDAVQAAEDGGSQPVSFSVTTSGSSNGWASADSQQVAKDTTTVTKTLSDAGKLFVGLAGSSVNPSLLFSGADGLMGDLLNIMGMGGSSGPTIADVMDELQEIQGKLDKMDQKLTNVENGVNIGNARTLIRSVNNLSTYCDSVANMFSDRSLARLGVKPCPEDADDKTRNAWLDEAVAAVEKADEDGVAGFIGYESDMNHIQKLFTNVANAAKEPGTTNPIGSWDNYWQTYYNWETEAWAPKQAMRTGTATQISRAYAQLSAYLGIYKDPDASPALTQLYQDSLTNIHDMDAGPRPEQACASMDKDHSAFSRHVYSYSLQRYATRFSAPDHACNYNATGAAVQDSAINEYKNRLHGMSVLDDLKLAGLVPQNYTPDSNTRGFSFQGEKSRGNWWVRTLNWDGSYNSVKSSNGDTPVSGNEFVSLGFELN